MMRLVLKALALSAGLVMGPAVGAPVQAQSVSEIEFAPGDFGRMVSGQVTGHDYADYRLRASSGQEMFVSLMAGVTNGDGTVYFNILPPGSDGVAIYNSSLHGNDTILDLPEDGVYTIRVYLMGNDRDAGKTVSFNMDLSIQ